MNGKNLSKLGQIHNEKEEEDVSVFETRGEKDLSLTYGEIKSESFEQLLNLALSFCTLDHSSGSEFCFYDLGGGTGKPVMTAALNPNSIRFSECCSIELIKELNDAAVSAHEHFTSTLAQLQKDGELFMSVNDRTTTPIGKNKNSKKNTYLSESEFLSCAANLISADNLDIKNTSDLANSLVNFLGHKTFKATMKANKIKQFGTFVDRHNLFSQEATIVTTSSITETEILSLNEKEGEQKSIFETHEKGKAVSIDDNQTENEEEVDGNELYGIFTKYKDLLSCFNQKPICKVTFLEGDIFDNTLRDWTQDAAIVYCASLLFTDSMMAMLLVHVMRMRRGSVFISLRELPLSSAEEVQKVRLQYQAFFQMSWQKANVFVYVLN